MKREREAPIGRRFEGEIRAWLRTRDAGPAPDRLRLRIARVAETEPAPGPGVWARIRPAAALAGVAAAAVLALAVVALRGVVGPAAPAPGGPLSSASLSGATPAASPYVVPALPVGPWPRTGPVLAVPLDGSLLAAVAALALIAALLIVAWLVRATWAEGRRAEFAAGWSWIGLWQLSSRRARLARGLAVLLSGALIAVGCGLLQFAQSTPLTYGGWEGVGKPADILGTRMGTETGWAEQYVAFVPGGQLQVGIDLANNGDLPLTVTSFDLARFQAEQPAGGYVASVELRLPAGATMDNSYDIGSYTQTLHPFELPPQGISSLWLVLHLRTCHSLLPGPSPEPSAVSNTDYLPTTAYVTFGELPFRYSVLGIERETDVRMPVSVGLVFGSNAVTC
jgi:hypothetical protein